MACSGGLTFTFYCGIIIPMENIKEYFESSPEWVFDNTLFLTKRGSYAYGLDTSDSDLDLSGICIQPLKYLFGFLNKFEQSEVTSPVDMVVFGLQKFFMLSADCNPNIIEMLWTDRDDHLITSKWSEMLISIREKFLSKKVRHTFSGYAMSQLKRIKTHRRWLLNPPKSQPLRKEFGLPETTVLAADHLGAIEAIKNNDTVFPPHVMDLYHRERSYANALREFQQYENWKKTRNKKRAELEAKFGMDTKHAMHLCRLFKMCKEVLKYGEVIVKRKYDREELLAIRNGAWDYDRLMKWSIDQDEELDQLERESELPHSPDRPYLDSVCIEMMEEYLNIKGEFNDRGFFL